MEENKTYTPEQLEAMAQGYFSDTVTTVYMTEDGNVFDQAGEGYAQVRCRKIGGKVHTFEKGKVTYPVTDTTNGNEGGKPATDGKKETKAEKKARQDAEALALASKTPSDAPDSTNADESGQSTTDSTNANPEANSGEITDTTDGNEGGKPADTGNNEGKNEVK